MEPPLTSAVLKVATPLAIAKFVEKVYDKTVKTYVYSLYGGPTSKIQLPKDECKTGLHLLQPFVVFQIFVPSGQPLTLELRSKETFGYLYQFTLQIFSCIVSNAGCFVPWMQ